MKVHPKGQIARTLQFQKVRGNFFPSCKQNDSVSDTQSIHGNCGKFVCHLKTVSRLGKTYNKQYKARCISSKLNTLQEKWLPERYFRERYNKVCESYKRNLHGKSARRNLFQNQGCVFSYHATQAHFVQEENEKPHLFTTDPNLPNATFAYKFDSVIIKQSFKSPCFDLVALRIFWSIQSVQNGTWPRDIDNLVRGSKTAEMVAAHAEIAIFWTLLQASIEWKLQWARNNIFKLPHMEDGKDARMGTTMPQRLPILERSWIKENEYLRYLQMSYPIVRKTCSRYYSEK